MAKPKVLGGLGFRDFQNFNTSLLAKISWRISQNPESLICKVLKGKYFSDSNILTVEATSSISHGWRGVLKGRNLLVQNLGWLIGDGHSIKFWNDPWLSLNNQRRPMGPPGEQAMNLTVADLLLPDSREWDREKIQILLPAYEDSILRLKPSVAGAPDKLAWLGTKTGEYTSKSGYYAAVSIEEENIEGHAGGEVNWKKDIWSLPCSPKIKLFAWKIFKGALPVGERLVERHIVADPKCKRCGEPESIIHLLFKCPFAQQVWLLAPLVSDLDIRGIIDLESCWKPLCSAKCLPPAGIASGTLVPWILWSLWKARNKFVFEGFSASSEDTLSTAIVMAREWSTNMNIPEQPLIHSRDRAEPHLPGSLVVVRSDAAWNSHQEKAGLGWAIFSNEEIRSFKKASSFVSSPLLVEGLALREAVKACLEMRLGAVRFESDSAQLIKSLTSGPSVSELYGVISDILSFAANFDFVSFTWISLERNSLADSLAKSALNVSVTLVDGEIFNALS